MATKKISGTRSDGAHSRQTILRAATRLATIEGLEGMSIARLADHIGMSKSGLYAHFGSKEELQLATVETAGEVFRADVIEPTEEITDPVERLRALCDGFLRHVTSGIFPGGCFFVSTSAEFATRPGVVKERILEFTDRWGTLFVTLMEEAQAIGEIQQDENPAQLFFELEAYLLLANMEYLISNDRQGIEHARKACHTRLDRATSMKRVAAK